jgi:hypothetical protein
MATPEYSIDYYILADDGKTLIDARGAQIFAVASKTDFEEVEELVAFHYDDLISASLLPTLKFLPEPSAKPVDVVELLTVLAEGLGLTDAEREALLRLRDEI